MTPSLLKTSPVLGLLLIVFSISCQKELNFPDDPSSPVLNETQTVKVLVLNYDPYFEVPGEDNKRIHEFYHWSDPRILSESYANAITEVSGGFIKFTIEVFIEWIKPDISRRIAATIGRIAIFFSFTNVAIGLIRIRCIPC